MRALLVGLWGMVVAVFAFYVCTGAAEEVGNGGFEILDAFGFPEGWDPVGERAESCTEAHTGQRSLKLLRTERALERGWETGANLLTVS